MVLKHKNFFNLTPDKVLSALESHGYQATGRYRVLNSYENRVFDVEVENPSTSLIIKFYRPHRWSRETILEEHQFLQELKEEGLPVAAPLLLESKNLPIISKGETKKNSNQTSLLPSPSKLSLQELDGKTKSDLASSKSSETSSTLWEHEGLWMAVFPKIRGRLVEEILPTQVPHLGRWLARLHNVGARKPAQHRPFLRPNPERLQFLEGHIPLELWTSYRDIAEEIFAFLDAALPQFPHLRVHGDFHRGNLIWNEDWTLIDFDDFLMAPAAQDFWIILSQLSEADQNVFVEAYQELRHWDEEEYFLLEPLRAYRIVQYSTWIAERWDDPSFPHLFPGFNEYNFWANELLALQKIITS